jgi:hypothetical protein
VLGMINIAFGKTGLNVKNKKDFLSNMNVLFQKGKNWKKLMVLRITR